MKKIRLSIFMSILFCVGYFIFYGHQNKIQAAPPSGYSDILTAPGVNIVPGANSAISEIDGDYGSMFKLTQYTSYEPFGEAETIEYDSHLSKSYRFHNDTVASEKGVWIRNAGMYNGRSVDLKLVIDQMDFADKGSGNSPYFNFVAVDFSDINSTVNTIIPNTKTWGEAFLFLGSTTRSASKINDTYTFEDNASYHYEFYDSETKKQLNYKGTWNFNNINIAKAVTTPFNNDFDKMFVLDSTWIGYKDASKPNYLELFGNGTTVNAPASRLTQLFESQSFATSMEKRYSNGNGGTALGAMGIMYSTESLARIAPAKPIIFAEKNSAVHTEADYGRIKYSILQTVADNKLENRNTTFSIETMVPSQYDIDLSKVRVYEFGTGETVEKTGQFTIAIDPMNSSRVILTAKDPTTNEFNGSVLEIKVEAKQNATFKFNKVDHNYQVGGKDDAHMIYELGGTTTTTHYTYLNRFSGDLNAEVVVQDDQTKAKVLYEGVPYGVAKTDVKIPMGGSIATAYPNAKDLLTSYDVDTGNEIDRPVTVSYVGTPPDISAKQPGDIVDVPLIMTSAKGVETPITVKIEITQTIFDLDIEHLDAETGAVIATTSPLPSGEADEEYLATSKAISGYIPTAVLVDGVDKTPAQLTDPLTVTAKFVTNKKVTFKYTKLRTPVVNAKFAVNPTTVPLGGQTEYTATIQNTAQAPTKWRNVFYQVDTPFPDKIAPDPTSVTVNGMPIAADKVEFNPITRAFKINLGDLDQNQVIIKYKVEIAADATLQTLKQTYTVSGDEAAKTSNETSLAIIAGESQLNVLYRKKDETNNDVKMDPDRDAITTQKDGTAFDITPETFDGYVLDKIIVDGQALPEPLPTSVKGKYGEISTIEFHYKGTLLITSAPSLLDFEMNEASAKELRVESAKTDKDLVVTDTRATKQRWYLYAKVTEDFKTTDGSNKTLSGILRYNDGGTTEKSFPVDQNQLLTSPDNYSDTKYNISQTWTAKGKGFKVEVPGDYVKQLGEYRAKIVYTLSEVPNLP
ncbi:hypothetical protein A5819_002404 [Enterococcus sp. 7E2_DIV0204]|uniref:hypothetical protein n=1 Tax=unclassified Enterococcus TaxID=2608891 RepID=UPI000A33B97A|nr:MULTISPECIES: hypothetical protein [unclassified Enterococcus]OTN89906.1 hypothetical protein A5819_002404 [Enterococcus sp. 7E2_DIV0204]OTP52362.1 hypothetical protein A5884_001563 [Enterococcus sp. 7D2_DIV0200]